MLCKYCHLSTHFIDECPTIICKICKKIGHPQWLCKDKKISKINYPEEIKKKSEPQQNGEIKNISYYVKLESKMIDWSELIDI
jgi:hypothetical protein